MSFQSSIRALVVATSVLLIAACHGVTEPITPGTTFVLESVGGASLPAVVGTIPSGAVLIADTLVFLSRNGTTSGQVIHYEHVVIGSVAGRDWYELRYNWRDGVLEFAAPACPPNALCAASPPAPDIGRFGPGSLTITYGTPGVFPRTYRRVN